MHKKDFSQKFNALAQIIQSHGDNDNLSNTGSDSSDGEEEYKEVFTHKDSTLNTKSYEDEIEKNINKFLDKKDVQLTSASLK